ncbi:hypothetical protein OF83DRAFT_532194 [Amylostereum chailletii]|nr:hypothetical protein OF83DRAFT_532194 [Amylostereum chailletii]
MRLCAQIFAPEKRTWVITAAGASRTLSGAETELLIRAMPNGIGGPYLQDQDCLELPPYARSKKRAHSPSDPSEQPPLKRVPSSPIPSSPVPASPPLPCRKGSLRRIMSSPGPVRSDGSGGSTLLRVDPRARAPADTARLSVVARLGIQDLAQNDWLPSILEFEEGDTEIDNPEVKPPSPTTASCADHAISTNDAVEDAAVLPSAAVATTPTPTTMPTPPPTIPIHIPSDAHLQDTPSESPSPVITSRRFNSRSRSSSSTTLKFPSEFSFSAIWKGVEEVNKAVVVEPKKGGPRETQSSAVLRVFGLRTCGASTFRYVVQVLHMGSPATWKRYLALGSSTAAAFGNYRHEVRGAPPDTKLPWEDRGVALDSAGSPASSASPSPPPQLFYEGAALPSPSSSLSGTTSMSSPALPSQIEESSGISSPANAILSNTRNGSLSGPDTFTNLGGAHGVAFDYAATQPFGDLFALLDGTAIAPSSMDDAALFADDMAPRTSTDNLLHTHTEISTFSPTGDSVPIEDWQPWDYGAFIPTPNTLQAINEAIS